VSSKGEVWTARLRIAQALVLIVLLQAFPQSSRAAVRLCEAPVSSGSVKGATESAARRGALAAWKAEAFVKHGERYTAWRLAVEKVLKCLPGKTGGFECLARAAPCTIEQAPARRELRKKRIGV
jgi:hypothetical protein